jgi:RNA polymerase sigma factor (sigma-70 family)
MTENDFLAERFEGNRAYLRAVAYRMLGSVSEADDAVQEAWLRLSRTDASSVENLRAWLTTVVARVALDMLRRRRHEEPLDHLPDPILSSEDGPDPEQQALLADSVGLALQVVLETLNPNERLAFVLHDMFGLSFDEIATIVDRSPTAARQMASRARRRVRGAAPAPDPDLGRQREVVDAFLAAGRDGDIAGLVAVLHPDVVLRVDQGPIGMREVRGAEAVAKRAGAYAPITRNAKHALVNGAVGMVAFRDDKPYAVGGMTIVDGQIVEMDILADPERVAALDLTILED